MLAGGRMIGEPRRRRKPQPPSLTLAFCYRRFQDMAMSIARSWLLRGLAFLLLVQWGTAFTQCRALADPLQTGGICAAAPAGPEGTDKTPDRKTAAPHAVCPVCQILANVTLPPPPPFAPPREIVRIPPDAARLFTLTLAERANPQQPRAPPAFL